MVIVVSRHGVRSPTHPDLTDRGAVLMRQFGAAYRRLIAPAFVARWR
jgi:hypothetical protein